MKKLLNMIVGIFLLTSLCYADDGLNAKAQKFLNDSLQDHSAPGVVMLISNDKVGTVVFAAGESNIENHTRMKVDDTFRIASMSKTFIAAAILKLVDEGKLKISDPISMLLPSSMDVKRLPNGEALTVKDLLQMRSGLPDYYQSDEYNALFSDDKNHIVTATEAVSTIYDKKPLFSPGKKYNYSNTNYVILQLIIEKVTQKPLAQALNSLIIDPLHLTHTYITEEKDFTNANDHRLTTHGYTLDDNKKFIDVTKKYDGTGLGDGCVVTDLSDLQKFLKALLEDKTFISSDGLKQMLHLVDDYGLGISAEETPSGIYYTHNGDASGYSGQYYLDKSNNLVIILTNSDETKFIGDLSDNIYQQL